MTTRNPIRIDTGVDPKSVSMTLLVSKDNGARSKVVLNARTWLVEAEAPGALVMCRGGLA